MNLILLTFGSNLENHYQAVFAILSYLKDPNIQRVIVITDNPHFYAFLAQHIEIKTIDSDELKKWQGQYQFFWRVKIKALEFVQQQYPNSHLLYVDSDTFLAKNLEQISLSLDNGLAFMHKKEYVLEDKPDNTVKKMYSSLLGKKLENIEINAQSAMWNAGVIAIPAEKAAQIIQHSLQLCDAMCATNCPRRLIEQFAFSLALNHGAKLLPCDQYIGHYWGNKTEWNQLISQFFVQAKLKNFSVEQCISEAQQTDWYALPLSKKIRNTNQKLTKWINRLFGAKNIRYFQH